MKTIIISLGGSVINNGKINIKMLKSLTKLINSQVHSKNKFIIITGGGQPAREYINAGKKLGYNTHKLDLIGIKATKLNAELVRNLFKKSNDKEPESLEEIPKLLKKYSVIVAGGFIPGMTSDEDAAILARKLNSEALINITNVTGVYTKDPGKYVDAELIKKMSFNELIKMASKFKTSAGVNFVFTLKAARMLKNSKTRLIVLKGVNNLKKFLEGKDFAGTTVF